MYCPSTGCDPWDQPANIFIDTDQGSYEIARFITPYGKGCGPWTVDVTDFKSLLKGEVTFRSFVQVWGQSGWLVDLDLEYVNGDTQKPLYNKITPLWLSQYWIYGDPNISHDLEEQSITVSENTQDSHIRMTLTGHGQGNTDNAAEFSRRTHRFLANGELLQIHTPWLNNCAQNECSNQAGTWTLSRAGWCPGQSVDPFIVNTSSTFAASQDIKIDYDLADYNNLLNTGYNSGSHTEPHFRIATYFIETSENRFIDYTNLRADHIIINTNGDVSNPAVNSLDFVISNNGITPINNPQVAYYVNNEFIFEESISTTIEAGETHTHSFSQISGFDFTEDNLVFAVVTADGDQNINDDVITKGSVANEKLVIE